MEKRNYCHSEPRRPSAPRGLRPETGGEESPALRAGDPSLRSGWHIFGVLWFRNAYR